MFHDPTTVAVIAEDLNPHMWPAFITRKRHFPVVRLQSGCPPCAVRCRESLSWNSLPPRDVSSRKRLCLLMNRTCTLAWQDFRFIDKYVQMFSSKYLIYVKDLMIRMNFLSKLRFDLMKRASHWNRTFISPIESVLSFFNIDDHDQILGLGRLYVYHRHINRWS